MKSLSRNIVFTFASYNQHGYNIGLVYLDLFLNKIRFSFRNISAVIIFSGGYAAWAMLLHAITGEWVYPVRPSPVPYSTSASFVAEISVTSPRKLCICII